MMRSLYTAATGMYAEQLNIDNIANNMANVSTTGFKKSLVQFQDLIYQTVKEAGSLTAGDTMRPVELTVGLGVKPVGTQKSFIQGSLVSTGSELDVAINGDGFFQIQKADGETYYTRDGSFKVTEEGRLTNSDGYYLTPDITLPADTESVTITADGYVLATVAGASQQVGQIELARFINPAGLKSIGGNLYAATDASGEATTGAPNSTSFGSLEQKYLENSNVVIVDEMVNMISAQRAYELNSKVVRTAEDMISIAVGLKRT